MKDSAKVIAALLIGAAAGAALGILLAPEKGSKIRGDIADYINDLAADALNKAQAKSDDLRSYGTNVFDRAKMKFRGAADDVSDYKDAAVETARSKARDIKDDAKNKFDEAKSKVKNNASDVNHSIQNS